MRGFKQPAARKKEHRAASGGEWTRKKRFNPHQVAHGGVLFALADTSMGAALYSVIDDQESCATIEMKMNFIKAVREGRLECETNVLRRGRNMAVLESKITVNGELAAIALGSYAIFPLCPPGKAT